MTYDEVVADYKALQDNDPTTAYRVMCNASTLMSFLETSVAEYNKYVGEAKVRAKAIEAQVALASAGSVAKGEKEAQADEAVQNKWFQYYQLQSEYEMRVAKLNYLKRIYYDSKDIWLLGNKLVSRGLLHD